MTATIRATVGLTILLLTTALPAGVTALGQEPTEGELRRLAEAYAQAWAKADAKALTGIYSTEAIRIGPEGKISVGRAAIELAMNDALRGPYRGTKIVLTPGQTARAAQDVSVSEGTSVIAGGMPPAGAATRGRYLQTLVRVSGRWLIAGDGAIAPPSPRPGK
jgi:uncharacterized protein (TIGR02246 family)